MSKTQGWDNAALWLYTQGILTHQEYDHALHNNPHTYEEINNEK